MMNLLVLGSSGMAGHVITLSLEKSPAFHVVGLSRSRKIAKNTVLLDLEDVASLSSYLDANKFDVIINCAGVLNQFAEYHKDKAILLNSYLPHFLEQRYRDTNTRIIHLSTDCVFSGKTGSYTEDAFRDGDTFYDRTKALGEIRNDKDLTLRMSIIGPDIDSDGIGLFNWFMKSKGEVKGYKNALWNGITTIELAKAMETAIDSGLTGLYHLVPDFSISKYGLLQLFKAVFSRSDIEITAYDNKPVLKDLINTRKDFFYSIPSYEKMTADMRDWIYQYKGLYPHYL